MSDGLILTQVETLKIIAIFKYFFLQIALGLKLIVSTMLYWGH